MLDVSPSSLKEQRKEGAVAGSTGAEDQAEKFCERDKKRARGGKRGQGVNKRCWGRLGKGGWLQTPPGKPDEPMLTLKTHRFSMETFFQLLQSEAKGCRKHSTDFRGFLAIALLNNTCFAGRKKHKKAKASACFPVVCKYSSICKHLKAGGVQH